jgi:predicted lipoprotein
MDKNALVLMLALAATQAAPASAMDEVAARAVMTRAVDGYIRPAYADFHRKASALTVATASLCAAPTMQKLKNVNARFAETIEAWGRVEIIREGPVLEQNRFERVLFYPDRKSIGLRQVQALLAKPDEAVTDAAALKNRSVAIQGLGAFDYIFFSSYPEGLVAEKNSYRCRYGLAIAGNVETIAGELDAAWSDPKGIANDWKNPSKDSAVYRDGAEAMQALIGLHVHSIDMVRDQRLKPFYKGPGQKVSPNAALFRRSGNTIRAISANVEGLETLWRVSGMDELLTRDHKAQAQNVLFDYHAAAEKIASLAQPSAGTLKDGAYLAKLDYIEFTLKDAMTRINNDVGAAVGLAAGFSFADGD